MIYTIYDFIHAIEEIRYSDLDPTGKCSNAILKLAGELKHNYISKILDKRNRDRKLLNRLACWDIDLPECDDSEITDNMISLALGRRIRKYLKENP